MTRSLSTAMANGISAATVRPILLLELEFSATVYIWTGIGTLAWNGHDWLGLGNLLEMSAIEETDSIEARGINIKLSGVPADQVQLALSELRTSKRGIIRLALDDGAGGIVANPKIIFRGRLDVGIIDDSDPSSPTIGLQYESELIDLERPREWRYTDEHQRLLHNGDESLRYIASYADKVLYWGAG